MKGVLAGRASWQRPLSKLAWMGRTPALQWTTPTV